MTYEDPSEDEMIDIYKHAPVLAGKVSTTLGEALAEEAEYCMADGKDRFDPAKRVAYMAKILHKGGGLYEDHYHLLPPTA